MEIVYNMTGRDSWVFDGGELGELDGVPFRLGFEQLPKSSATPSQIPRRQLTSAGPRLATSPFFFLSFFSFLTFIRSLSGDGFEKPSLVSAWVRFLPIWVSDRRVKRWLQGP